MLRPYWVILGDSLTQRAFEPSGWGAAIANQYARSIDVLNRGYGGYNSRWILRILPRILPDTLAQEPPQLLTIWLGANDAVLPDSHSAKQHVPVEEYGRNLAAIIAHARGLGVPRVLVLTPPPVDEAARVRRAAEQFGLRLERAERTAAAVAEYAAAARAAAAAAGAPCLDLHAAVQAEPGWQQELLCDGLHFSPRGQEMVGQLVLRAVQAEWPELAWNAMPWECPDHAAITVENWEQALLEQGP